MTCPGVIHRDERADLQTGHQPLVLLRAERRVVPTQEGVDLAHRAIHPPLAQLLVQQRLRDLAVMMLVEHELAQAGTEMAAVEVGGQFAAQPLPRRGLPHLQAIAGVERFDLEVLDHEVAIAFKARSCRQRLREGHRDLLMDRQLVGLATLVRAGAFLRGTFARGAGLPVLWRRGVSRRLLFHPTRFEGRLALLALEHGDLIAQLLNHFRLPLMFPRQRFDQHHQPLDPRRALRVGDLGQVDRAGHVKARREVER
jgi:hypothetical protein